MVENRKCLVRSKTQTQTDYRTVLMIIDTENKILNMIINIYLLLI